MRSAEPAISEKGLCGHEDRRFHTAPRSQRIRQRNYAMRRQEIPYSAAVYATTVNVCNCVQVEGITLMRRNGRRKKGVQTEKYPSLTTGVKD